MTGPEDPGVDRNTQTELGRALRMAWWNYMQRLNSDMRSDGFDKQRFAMLYMYAVYAEPDSMTISKLGRRFSVSRQAASVNVALLRRRGYLKVVSSPTDNREKLVRLTPRAVKYIEARLGAAAALDAKIRERIGDAEVERLMEMLADVADVAGGAPGPDLA